MSHYIKVMLDYIFGTRNYRNEIVWYYRRWTANSKDFQRIHDIIFRYSKSENFKFNLLYQKSSNEEKGIKENWIIDEESGKKYRWQSLHGKRYKIWKNEEGVKIGDVWSIPFLHPSAKERLGYPTQKPEKLLERIILASSEGEK